MSNYILPLNDERASLALVGGKGQSLARLARAGLPVPDGFHITTTAYDHFVQENQLQPRILAALQQAASLSPVDFEQASRTITTQFTEATLSGDLADEIFQAYAALPGNQPAVAVRSSATAEDLPDASFAGQQESYLNICGTQNLLEAVKRCWASLWTARAIAYRAQRSISPNDVSLAVVVQQLVDAQSAGILFTANPINNNPNEVLINASWGLGEAVVGGQVTPDTLIVERSSGRLLQRTTADKHRMTVRCENGTREEATPETLRLKPVLSDAQAVALTHLGERVEALYAVPMDIEWAIEKDTPLLLQARPITTLGRGKEDQPSTPLEWPLPNPKASYARGSLCEHLPNPLSPLFATLGIDIANQAAENMLDDMQVRGISYYTHVVINGYTYMGFTLTGKDALIYTRMMFTQTRRILFSGQSRWLNARQQFQDKIAAWDTRDIRALSVKELLTGVVELEQAAMHFYTIIQSSSLPQATASEFFFTRLYNLVRRPGDPPASQLLLGFDSSPLRAEKALFDLARWIQDNPSLASFLHSTSSVDQVSALCTTHPPSEIPQKLWDEWKSRFERHLATYSRTVYDFDFVNPTPAETPEIFLDVIKMHLEGKGSDPYARQEKANALRNQTLQVVLSRAIWPVKGWLVSSLNWAKKCLPGREDSLADLGMANFSIRRLLKELGQRLVSARILGEPTELYWLEKDELFELVDCLDHALPTRDLSQVIQERQSRHKRQLSYRAPAILPEKSRWGSIVPWREKDTRDKSLIKGLGASAGVVTAPACVLLGPEDFHLMRPGCVLVAVTTTPAWTPLFAKASAVVTDIGGPLSHSSIVAREYGIPAVMSTASATRQIRNGQTITVDGTEGTVKIVSN